MKTWIFQGNTKYFDVNNKLENNEVIDWSVNQFKEDIDVGDIVYMWRTDGDVKNSGGVVSKGIIVEYPIEKFGELKTLIRLHEIRLTIKEGMISRKVVEQNAILKNNRIITVRAGSNFEANEAEAKELNKLWNVYSKDYFYYDVLKYKECRRCRRKINEKDSHCARTDIIKYIYYKNAA